MHLHKTIKENFAEFIYLLATSCLVIYLLFLTYSFNRSAGAFPRLVLMAILIFIAIRLVDFRMPNQTTISSIEEEEPTEPAERPRIKWYVYAMGIVAYVFLIEIAGFIISTICYSIAMPIISGYRNKVGLIVLIVCTGIGLLFFIKALHILFPSGLLFS